MPIYSRYSFLSGCKYLLRKWENVERYVSRQEKWPKRYVSRQEKWPDSEARGINCYKFCIQFFSALFSGGIANLISNILMVKLFLEPLIILKLVSFLWNFVFISTPIYANLCTFIKTMGCFCGEQLFLESSIIAL